MIMPLPDVTNGALSGTVGGNNPLAGNVGGGNPLSAGIGGEFDNISLTEKLTNACGAVPESKQTGLNMSAGADLTNVTAPTAGAVTGIGGKGSGQGMGGFGAGAG